MGPSPYLWIFHAKQRLLEQCTSLYGTQTSPVVLCMQYSVIITRITCLYAPQPLSEGFSCKTATFGAELQLCMGTRPHLSFCAFKSAWLAPELLVSMGPRHNLSFCAYKTAWLAPELLVSMGPRPHLWILHTIGPVYKSLWVPDLTCQFVHTKQSDLHQNDMFTWVPALICGFVHAKQWL